jgi:hypothetical protein
MSTTKKPEKKTEKKPATKCDPSPRMVLANYYIPASAHALLKRLAKRAARSTRAHASLLLEEAIRRPEHFEE